MGESGERGRGDVGDVDEEVTILRRIHRSADASRFFVWFGLVPTLFSIYPALYAIDRWDDEAAVAAAIAFVIGAPLLLWTGWRIDDPPDVVIVDRGRGLVRLEPEGLTVAIGALGKIRERGRKERRRNKNTTYIVQLVDVHAEAFGGVSLHKRQGTMVASDWVADFNAALREFDPTGWRWDESDVEAVMKGYKRTDRNRLLWRAAAFAGDEKALRKQVLARAAREMDPRNLTDWLARVVAIPVRWGLRHRGLVLALMTALTLLFVIARVATRSSGADGLTLAAAAWVVVVSQLWRAKRRGGVGVALAGTCALSLFIKPFILPLLRERYFGGGGIEAASVTSEIHMWYLLCGAGLAFYSLVFAIVVARNAIREAKGETAPSANS